MYIYLWQIWFLLLYPAGEDGIFNSKFNVIYHLHYRILREKFESEPGFEPPDF